MRKALKQLFLFGIILSFQLNSKLITANPVFSTESSSIESDSKSGRPVDLDGSSSFLLPSMHGFYPGGGGFGGGYFPGSGGGFGGGRGCLGGGLRYTGSASSAGYYG